MQWIRNLFSKKNAGPPKSVRRPLPSDPDFDINSWLDRRREIEEKNSERLSPFFPTASGLQLGISDHSAAEAIAEQDRRLVERECQEEEAKQASATPQRSASRQ